MEILLALLFLYGCYYAMSEGAKGAWRAYRRSPPGAHHRAGYVASQVASGFPEFRHAVAAGWHRHRTAALGARAHREKARTDREIAGGHLRDLIEEYRRQRAAGAASPPGPGQPPAAPGPGVPPGDPDVEDWPPVTVSDPQTGRQWTDGQPAEPPPDLTAKLIKLLQEIRNQQTGETETSPPPGGDGKEEQMTTNGSGQGDINLESTKQVLDRLIAAMENAISPRELQDAISLADSLPGVIPNDKDILGDVADLASMANQAQRLQAEIMDAARALREQVSKTYDETQDAVDASGTDAPQPEFLRH